MDLTAKSDKFARLFRHFLLYLCPYLARISSVIFIKQNLVLTIEQKSAVFLLSCGEVALLSAARDLDSGSG